MDYKVIIELVKKASQTVFDKTLRDEITLKGKADFVTAVDLKISEFLKEELYKIDPSISFMSEEGDGGISDDRWILDPIDGTTNLVYGYNMSSVSLARYTGGDIVFGVVYNPYNGDLFTAEKGKGAYLNGEKLEKAPDREIEDCLIEFGAGSTKKQYADVSFALATEIFKECLDLRRICSTAIAISYVAAGRLNGYFEKSIKPWDYAAAYLILSECGGKCQDWEGNAIQFDKASSFVCGTPKAFKFLTEKIKKHFN